MNGLSICIRPKEILLLKFQDIDLINQVVIIRFYISKNRNIWIEAIPIVMIEYLWQILKSFISQGGDLYVFLTILILPLNGLILPKGNFLENFHSTIYQF